jgi:hypothetical protein
MKLKIVRAEPPSLAPPASLRDRKAGEISAGATTVLTFLVVYQQKANNLFGAFGDEQ